MISSIEVGLKDGDFSEKVKNRRVKYKNMETHDFLTDINPLDETGICPKCDGKSILARRAINIDVMYEFYTCKYCENKWRRVYHYIGMMGEIKRDFYEEGKDLMHVIKEGIKVLDKKYKDAPVEFKNDAEFSSID
jgi:hypothetical protein